MLRAALLRVRRELSIVLKALMTRELLMTPQERCVRRIDEVRDRTDSSVVRAVEDALAELEASFSRASDQVLALERVHQAFSTRRRRTSAAPYGRFVSEIIDRRQDVLLRQRA